MILKKICMLGSFSVGKTSLVRRFVESMFSDAYLTTVGVKIDKKQLQVDGQDVSLMLWDIYGEDEFQKLRMSYLRGAAGFVFVADGTRLATLEKALTIKEEAEKALGPLPYLLVLNKCDLADRWEIDADRESVMAAQGVSIIRTSAKTGQGVEDVFTTLARAMLRT
jgi:hypothetical protein